MNRAAGVLLALSLSLLSGFVVAANAKSANHLADAKCEDVPLGLVARIEAGMKYFDVWLQAPRAVRSDEFGQPVWFVAADVGGPDYQGNGDMAHWLTTSLDPDTAEIYKVDKGHAKYLSRLPSASQGGFDVGFLTEGLAAAQECAQNAADDTGGLGIDRKTWEKRHGTTNTANGGFATKDGEIRFRLEEGRIAEITWSSKEHLPVAQAKVLSHDLIPDDALLAGDSAEAPPSSGDQPVTYASKWLAKRFKGTGLWRGAKPGAFVLTVQLDDEEMVGSFTLKTGNQ